MTNSKFKRRKEEPWDRVPKKLRREHGVMVANVYAVLLDVCARGMTMATVCQNWLARECKTSLATIKRTLKKLEELGLIRKIKHSRASTYEVKPVIRLKGEWKNDQPETVPYDQQSPSDTRTAPFKRKWKNKADLLLEDDVKRQEMNELGEYARLVNCFDDEPNPVYQNQDNNNNFFASSNCTSV